MSLEASYQVAAEKKKRKTNASTMCWTNFVLSPQPFLKITIAKI